MKIVHNPNYADKRRSAYPPVEEQLDLIFHKGIDAWKQEIAKIKSIYPKPNDQP